MSGGKVPKRMLPQSKIGFVKFKQSKYRKAFPPEYKNAAMALHLHDTQNIDISETLPGKNARIKNINALAELAIQHSAEITYLLNKLNIVKQNDRQLSVWEARILIAEIMWGKQFLKTSHYKVEAVKFYEEDLREAYIETSDLIRKPSDSGHSKLPRYIRINTLSISIDDTLRAFCKEGWNLLPRCNSYLEYLSMLRNLGEKDFIRDYHISELLAFPPGTAFYNHPGYVRGKFLYQDKGSCLSSFLLNPKPGSVVLDTCAAPGKKTNHMANIMGNTGIIYANDIHHDRLQDLNKLMELTDVTCAKAILNDIINIDVAKYQDVRYILVDPSCSYSGIFYCVGQRMKKVGIQRRSFSLNMILRFALQSFPNVKRVVYTTCSVYPEEGESVVDEALKEIGGAYTLLNVREMLWNEWESVGHPGYNCSERCLRVVPELDLCQGYFIAVFERNFDEPLPPYVKKFKKSNTVYTVDEEQIKKTDNSGRIVRAFLARERRTIKQRDKAFAKKIQVIKRNALNDNTTTYNAAKDKKFQLYAQVFKPEKMKYVNPNLRKIDTSAATTTTTNNTASEEIFETTHSQLYP